MPEESCGFYGNCGAAVGTGIFISLILDSIMPYDVGWELSTLMTSKSLFSIAECGGPRCCKRSTFLALIEAADFVDKNIDVEIEIENKIKCDFSSLNKECLKENCPFY